MKLSQLSQSVSRACSVITLGLTVCASAFAVTSEQADLAYEQRDLNPVGLAKALEAANLYEQLANEQTSVAKKADFFIKESRSLYFYAENSSDLDIKKEFHKKGWDIGEKAAKLLVADNKPTQVLDPSYAPIAATAYYWMGANMGKWGLANGVVNSLRRWPELRQTMEYIQALGQNEVEYYGANRILARSLFKLPFPIGDKDKALELLEEASANTLSNDGLLSLHSTNVIYLAEVLFANGDEARGKELLEALIALENDEEALKNYNPERVPETKADIIEAKKLLSRL